MNYQQITASFLRMLANAIDHDPQLRLRQLDIRKIHPDAYRFMIDDDGYDVELVVKESEINCDMEEELDAFMAKNVIAVMLNALRDIGEEPEEVSEGEDGE